MSNKLKDLGQFHLFVGCMGTASQNPNVVVIAQLVPRDPNPGSKDPLKQPQERAVEGSPKP